MPNIKPIYYWDSSIFIAWLKNENRPAGEMDGVFEAAERIDKNQAFLLVSQFLNVELLPCKLPADAMTIIARVFMRKNTSMAAIDSRVTSLAQQIRNWKPNIKGGDSVHLATAVHYRADQFHTFDGGLLSLNGDVAGNLLTICKPPITQYRLPGI